ncbi:long-chain fatty acid--CoA ligase [Comamonas sp. 26]|uniref:AMP-dependent synthetase/ligase n=1 Tax=Comamonas sp. 26 TaxID=2035201 RepID=UPI000C1A3970|nr:AMP-binding protein [Comamonas sp. 26]PIG07398.1 long-chain acyl-CoA synthetase [Comamonas sp. 26]
MTTTFPQLLLKHATERPDAPALREKEYGIWQTWSWREAAQTVRHMACGLRALGLARGQNLAFISDNRPHVYMGFLAVQACGAVPIPLYQDAVAAEMMFVMEDAEIAFAFAENQEQVDKLLEVRESVASIRHIIYDDPRGLRKYDQPGLISTEDLLAKGKEWDAQNTGAYEAMIQAVQPEDVSVILYTSGTTGKPKGVCQTHASFGESARGGAQTDKLNASDNVICYLPPAWVGDHLFSFAQWLVAGFTINCPESAATISIDLREIGPSYYFAPPRIFEGMLTSVSIRMEDASPLKQWMYAKAMGVARRVGSDILDGKSVGAIDRLKYQLGNLFIYGPLRNAMGLSRIRVAYTAGAAIGPELFRFFRSIGINLKQLYGQTETCAYVCLQRDGQVELSSVGQAAPGIELKIADNGEVLVKGVSVLKEYYKRPDATAEVMDANGYFHTGDAGVIDASGQLRIIDRAKDVGKTSRGAMFAPNYIENKLKFFPHIKEAVCFGHGKDEVCAFINIDYEAVGNWAERQGLPYGGYVDLASKAKVLELVAECIGQVNADLASEPGMADTQVARFLVLHKELDPDDDELTRTRKVRRNFIADKYGVLIEALYTGKKEQFIETLVKFEDGRTGSVSATLSIVDASIHPAAVKAVA